MNKIKQFFTRKRCKSFKLLNQKGFSLIEIMVALGLITLLTALAVPQYTSYKKTVKVGVIKSILLVPHRTMTIEESLGNKPHSIDQNKMMRTIKSKAVGDFTVNWKTDDSTSPDDWCFELSAGQGDYSGFSGCVDNAGAPQVGGEDISCNQAKASYIYDAGSSPATCTTINCPTPDCVNDNTGKPSSCTTATNWSKPCKSSANKDTFTKTAACSGSRKCQLN